MPHALDDITVVLVARNAAATIGRAVASARAAGAAHILLVDDASSDETMDEARSAAGGSLTLVRNKTPVSVGYVRGLALRHIKTPFGLWLDADDEMADGYIAAMRQALVAENADLVFAGCDLVDGATGNIMKRLEIPEFVRGNAGALRSFERNWFPSLLCAFRTEFACSVAYDPDFVYSEDYDFLLRALAANARVSTISDAAYRYYHYGDSLSRNRFKVLEFTARALKKHVAAEVATRLEKAGFSPADRDCILMSKAMFEQDLEQVQSLAVAISKSDLLIAPYGLAASDVARFFSGTAHLLAGDFPAAAQVLEPLANRSHLPEVLNNVAVAKARAGDQMLARQQFQAALGNHPGFLDAQLNLAALADGKQPQAITTHPLRRAASRDIYGE